MKTRSIEVYYGYYVGDAQMWDTEYVEIPIDTPEDKITEVALKKFSTQQNNMDNVFKGILCIPPKDDEVNFSENNK